MSNTTPNATPTNDVGGFHGGVSKEASTSTLTPHLLRPNLNVTGYQGYQGTDPYWIRYGILKEEKYWPDSTVEEGEVCGGGSGGIDPYWIRYGILKEEKYWPDSTVEGGEVCGGGSGASSETEPEESIPLLDSMSLPSLPSYFPWKKSGESWEAAEAEADEEMRRLFPDFEALQAEIAAYEEQKKPQG